MFGGYEGYPAHTGGRDRFITTEDEAEKIGAAAWKNPEKTTENPIKKSNYITTSIRAGNG